MAWSKQPLSVFCSCRAAAWTSVGSVYGRSGGDYSLKLTKVGESDMATRHPVSQINGRSAMKIIERFCCFVCCVGGVGDLYASKLGGSFGQRVAGPAEQPAVVASGLSLADSNEVFLPRTSDDERKTPAGRRHLVEGTDEADGGESNTVTAALERLSRSGHSM
jgi:hypothetical protein